MTMNNDARQRIAKLNEELERLQKNMSECREEFGHLRRKKRELAETRRGLRQQRRECEQRNDAEALNGFNIAVAQLDGEIEILENRINDIENDIDEIDDAIGDIKDELDDIKADYEGAYGKKGGVRIEIGGKDIGKDIGEGIHKAMSKLTEINFDELGDTIERAVDSAVTGINRGFSHVVTTVSGGSGGDCCFAGFGTLTEGEYDKVTFAGSGKITGDISCATLKSSGSVSSEGSIDCRGEIKASGSLRCEKNVSASALKTSGSVSIGGSFTGGVFNTSGSASIGGELKAEEVKAGGSVSVSGSCESERFYCAGRLCVSGLLNAGCIELKLDGLESRVPNIGCDRITVTRSRVTGVFHDLGLKSAGGRLVSELIEGDEIRLENTSAKTVRGRDVYIGSGCDIERVEYTNICEVSGNAAVSETVRQ